MTPSQKLRSIADSTGLDGIADAIREIANEIEHNNAPAVPQGWKLVPIEPTPAMRLAGRKAPDAMEEIWAAMLGATPAPAPAQPIGRTELEIVEQTEELAAFLMDWRWGQAPESPSVKFRSTENVKAQKCWAAACHIQEMITATDVENAVAEVDDDPEPDAAPAQEVALKFPVVADPMQLAHMKECFEYLKAEVGTKGWVEMDFCNYMGFFMWGFEAARQSYAGHQPAAPVQEPVDMVPRAALHEVERERDWYKTRAQTMHEHQNGQVWYWQGDGEDHPETLVNSLPVVIRVDQLRELIAKPAQDAGLTDEAVNDAAKVLAGRMDYPWEHMPEEGRKNMRVQARAVVEAALRAKGGK